MDEENVLNFVSITSCDPDKAAQYLRLTDNNLEQAATASSAPAAASSSASNAINVDSDEEMSDFNPGAHTDTPPVRSNLESDEELARRLQEEDYGGGGAAQAQDEVRAPIQRTQETLVGPGANWGPADEDDDIDAMVQEQLARRQRGKHRACT
jgi:hypothetical protein